MAIDKYRLVKETPCGYQETLGNFWNKDNADEEMQLQVDSLVATFNQIGRQCIVQGSRFDDYRRIIGKETGQHLALFQILYEDMS